MEPEDLRSALARHGILAVIRGSEPDAAVHTAVTLAECGIPLVEVSLSTPDACAIITSLRDELGDGALVGAGTILTADDARRVHDAGAQYAVTPAHTYGEQAARAVGLPILAGALTPSEIVAAHHAGAAAVKVFPASTYGPAYIKAVKDPLPQIPLVPVGGVDSEAAYAYLTAGALAVGVGSPLVGDAASGGSLDELRRRAREFTAMIAAVGA